MGDRVGVGGGGAGGGEGGGSKVCGHPGSYMYHSKEFPYSDFKTYFKPAGSPKSSWGYCPSSDGGR